MIAAICLEHRMRSTDARSATMPTARGRRRGAAWLAVFALLLQAILFGWHHHDLPLPARQTTALLALANPAPAHGPSVDDQDCQICIGLHHLSAAPCDFVALPPPPAGDVASASEPDGHACNFACGFRARAPPSA